MPESPPPRLAERVLHGLLGNRPSRPFILADLAEEYAERHAHHPGRARQWYWRQAVLLGLRFRLTAGHDLRDPADLSLPTGDHMRLELRLAWRAIRRRPLLSGTMVLTIGLAIAAATTVFAVVNGILLTPLPYREPGRLVAVWETAVERGRMENVVSPANFLAWRERSRSFEHLAALVQFGVALTGDGDPEQVGAMQATAGYFAMVGATPIVGRLFGEADDVPGAPRTAVLSEGFWLRRYGADPAVVGRTIAVNGRPVEIIGVLRASDDFAPRVASFFSTRGRDLWLPAQFGSEALSAGGRYLQVVGRLAPQVTIEAAQAEMATIASALRMEHVERQAGWDVRVAPLHDDLVGETRTPLLVVFAAVGLVLLVAGANVADLQLTRTLERQQEIAVRAALGAGKGRLVRQLLAEGALIAGLGGLGGLLLAKWAIRGLVATAPDLPRLSEVGLEPPVVAFALLVSAGSALLFGLAPAVSLGRGSLSGWLTHRAPSARAGAHRAKRLLVGAQVAFSFMLLVGAALLIRSMANRLGVDIGIRSEGVAVADFSLPSSRFPNPEDRVRFIEQLLERVRELPGVTMASAGSGVPMSGIGQATTFRVADRPPPAPGQEPVADVRFVHHGYHEALGIGLVEGRYLGAQDRKDSPVAVLVNETGARLLWPGESAVGKRVEMEWGPLYEAEVVGVVRDVNLQGPDVAVERATLYWEYTQVGNPGTLTLLVKASTDPAGLLPGLRRVVSELDPTIPLFNASSMAALLEQALAKARFVSTAFGLFATLALLLATIGLYGVMASATIQRTREIGIRMALGASGMRVRRMVLRQGLGVVGPAILVGAAVSIGLAGVLRSMVFEVSPSDPPTYLAVAIILGLTAVAACWIPANRASTVDPLEAIRSD